MMGISDSGEGLTDSKSRYAYLLLVGYFIAIGVLAYLHYRRYLKQNKDWGAVWNEALGSGMERSIGVNNYR